MAAPRLVITPAADSLHVDNDIGARLRRPGLRSFESMNLGNQTGSPFKTPDVPTTGFPFMHSPGVQGKPAAYTKSGSQPMGLEGQCETPNQSASTPGIPSSGFPFMRSLSVQAKAAADDFAIGASHAWEPVLFTALPKWLQINNYLHDGHRPPLHSYSMCSGSVFRIHTETGNIWTHLLGFIAFIGVAAYYVLKPSDELNVAEKMAHFAFFFGAVACLGFSFTYHTFLCHSEKVNDVFHKLDYCGIALLTMGSFVPYLYYIYYCRLAPQVIYNTMIIVMGSSCIIVSMLDKFAAPKFRPVRAGTFIGLGLSGIFPAFHFAYTDGWADSFNNAGLGWLILMAVLYIVGAIIYACRVPERIWPGKFDIWFQSHQIFHVCVVTAAFVHLHGINQIADYRHLVGMDRSCSP